MRTIFIFISLFILFINPSFGQAELPFEEATVKIEKVYPNPVSSHVFVQIKQEDYTHAQFELVDILGNKIQKWEVKQLFPGSQKVKLQFKSLRTGIYLLKIKVGNKIFIKRLRKA